jgi:DNA-binding XRE family transcriptional regulator
MTALQFSRRRKNLFRSQQKAADAMGLIQQTISGWETGRRPVPRWAVKFLECLERSDRPCS